MSAGSLPYLLIGNPENRRVSLFQEALRESGSPPATVISHLELCERPERLADLPDRDLLVRIESAGENPEVERALLALGHPCAVAEGVSTISPEILSTLPPRRGQILPPRQAHLGFLRHLERIGRVLAERPGWRPLSAPETIALLFDKRQTSRRYAAEGIPVPPALFEVESPEALRGAMRERGYRAVFVKLASGSSASCLGVFHHALDQEFLMTTIEQADDGWYNSLRVRRVNDRRRIDELLGFLLREGSQIELAVPKARLDGASFDCRVLCVDGEPSFTVIRQSRHPITNLHLGGWRGRPESLAAILPAELARAAEESCRRVAALHAENFQLGIDLLYEAGWRGHRVIEANAFGDLLPNLTRDGLGVYAWQIRAAARRFQSAPVAPIPAVPTLA
jgi:hypothetical protein